LINTRAPAVPQYDTFCRRLSKNPKTTLDAIATGLESLSLLIKDDTLRKVFLIISPAIALVGMFLFKIRIDI
jgi:hypothetical protein